MQINNKVSNTTSLPVATGSRTCQNASVPGVDLTQLATSGSFALGTLELDHFLNDNGIGYFDKVNAFFARISGLSAATSAFLPAYLDNAPIGTCTVIGASAPSDLFFNNLINNGNAALLDAGSTFTVTGPKGSMQVQTGSGVAASLSTSGAYLVPGDYTVTGTGGKDVGAFTAHITVPATPTLISPATPNGLTITRANGMTVTWNPNGSTGHVEIVISSFVDQNTGAQAWCTAPASAGTFTIPPYVLLAVPASNLGNFFFQPGDQGPAFSTTFTATGLTAGIAQSFLDSVQFVAVVN